MRHKRKIIES